MKIKEFLNQADRIYNDEGITCDFGCSKQSVPTMIEYVQNNLSDYPYAVVSSWKWVDIDVSDKTREGLNKYGFKPSTLIARNVIADKRNRGFKSVQTSLLQGFYQNCIFLTQNTAYILCNSGKRVSIDPRVYYKMMG